MELINNISLSPTNCGENIYQPIYSSQLYGTFFIVYANFETSEDSDNYFLHKIKLKIINYKGLINLGITGASFYKTEGCDPENPIINNKNIMLNYKGGYIELKVRALYNSDNDILVDNISEPIKISKNNSYLNVTRKLDQMHGDDRVFENGVFDNEFFYRDGIEKDEAGNWQIYSEKRSPKPNNENENKGHGNARCPRSTNRIL